MKYRVNFNTFSLSAVIAILFFFGSDTCAERVRNPVWAGSFYPAQQSVLSDTINQLTARAKLTQIQLPPSDKPLKALIMPHAGYIYSGLTAAHTYRVLSGKKFKKIILVGPDHRVGFPNFAISDVDAYKTPLGDITLHKDAEKLRNRSSLFNSIPVSDKSEHSLEVILPFLQLYLPRFELIPVVIGQQVDIEQLVAAIRAVLDSQTLFVASSDLSHYLPYDQAVESDRETINMILKLEYEKLLTKDNAACGKLPILTIIKMAKQFSWQPVLLHYSNSGDTQGGKDRVVGYAAIAFYGGLSMKQLNHNQGQALVKLARYTISNKIGGRIEKPGILEKALTDDDLKARCGTFVTLHIDGQLRGCIGSLTSSESILDGIKSNALNAAFNDYRFSPLTVEELDKIDIEISVLTDPMPLEFKDGNDLISKLRANVDGVIIRKGGASATFLPQVWEQLPDPADFLSNLCRKAGLSTNAWEKPGLKVLTYQVQYFEEE